MQQMEKEKKIYNAKEGSGFQNQTHLKGSFFCSNSYKRQQWLVTIGDKWLSGDLVLVLVHYLQLWFQ